MHSFQASNVNEAMDTGVRYIQLAGKRETSRNGGVLVAPEPVCTVNMHPMQHASLSPVRDANPFFHVVESAWMLAGRNDLALLQRYSSNFGAYSDDGVTLHGAYGHRWRRHFGFDQLPLIIEELRKHPDSRRCVLEMWDVRTDLPMLSKGGKDVPCLAGDTVLRSPEGDLKISEVAGKFSRKEVSRWPVYTVDIDTANMRLAWATDVWLTGRKKVMRVTFDDGSALDMTSDHRLYRRGRSVHDATECEVKDLVVGDRVLASALKVDRKGYLCHKKNLAENTNFRNMQKVHREYAELLHGSLGAIDDVHHENEDKVDNRAVNLRRLEHGEHAKLNMHGDRNPMRRLSPEAHATRARKHSVSLTATWARKKATEKCISASNHRITKIEHLEGEVEVYDFTVPATHNALIGTGVVAHNCNTHAYFDLRGGVLNMTVCNRSNDAIWGAYGANAVHFSFLQEYMAANLAVPVGVYRQVSNNLHIYTEKFSEQQLQGLTNTLSTLSPYPYPHRSLMHGDVTALDADLAAFQPGNVNFEPASRWFLELIVPVMRVWELRKAKASILTQVDACDDIVPADWARACREWIERRIK